MASEKAALVEMFNGTPGQCDFPHNPNEAEASSGDAQHQNSVDNITENLEPPSYQESAISFDNPQDRPTSPPPRPPPPSFNRPTTLPVVMTNQPSQLIDPSHLHQATVMMNAPVTSQPAFMTVPGVPAMAITQERVLGYQSTVSPTQNVATYIINGPRQFSSRICDGCSDCHTCCCGTFCACCYLGSMASKLNESCMNGVCCMAGLAPLRTKFRLKHNIDGSICNDVCVSTCCSCCVVCQMGREMDILQYEKQCGCC